MHLLRALRPRPYGPAQLPSPAAIAAGVGVTAVAALAGWQLAAHLTAEPSAAPEGAPLTVRLASSAELSLRKGWTPVDKAPRLPGLDGPTSRAFAPADGGAGRMVVAMLPDATGEALPRATVAELRTPLGRGTQTATVGGLRGSGYTALALRDVSGLVDVYAVPTAAGVLAVGCVAPLDDPLPVGACPSDIVSVVARKPPAADPLQALRAKLPAVVTSLNAARRSGRRALRSGATSNEQARAAARLAAAYRTAASRTAALAPKTGTSAALPGALTAAAAAYGRLEAAATRHDNRAWRRARADVDAAEQAAQAGLAALRAG